MPITRLRACPRCGKTIDGSKKYCDKCQMLVDAENAERYKRLDKTRKNSNERGYNYKWQKESKDFLKRFPICNICGQKTATEVDHIIPHKGNQGLFWDKKNWQPICSQCHKKKTAKGL